MYEDMNYERTVSLISYELSNLKRILEQREKLESKSFEISEIKSQIMEYTSAITKLTGKGNDL